ncbi:hypothetical protein DL771_005470 [Monosporascus sp. 5C6A]|nr:hypothetical protein DL771_005470 [Monosporascus sp. 5C6A]
MALIRPGRLTGTTTGRVASAGQFRHEEYRYRPSFWYRKGTSSAPRDYPVVGEPDGKEPHQNNHVTEKERRHTSGVSLDLPKTGRPAANQELTTASWRRSSRCGARKARSLLAAIELALMLAPSAARPKAKAQEKAAARSPPSSAKAATITQTDLMNVQRIFLGWISNRGHWSTQNAKYASCLLLVTPADAGKGSG